MADESDEEVLEDQNGLSKVDDAEPPEEMPRPEKPEDDPELMPDDVEELVPEDGDGESVEDEAGDSDAEDDAGDDDAPESHTGDDDVADETAAPDATESDAAGSDDGEAPELTGVDPSGSGEDAPGGLRKVDPEDRDGDTHSKRPNTRGPDSADEMAPSDPGEELPFDPEGGYGTGLGPNLSDPDRDPGDDAPPPGHAAGAPTPEEFARQQEESGETDGEDRGADPAEGPGEAAATDGSTEAAAADGTDAVPAGDVEDAEARADDVEGETTERDEYWGSDTPASPGLDPDAIEQVEKPPAEPDVETAEPGEATTEESPLAEPDFETPDYEEEWDAKPSQPPDDEEMPLAEHVEEMVQRFGVVLLTLAVGTAVSFIVAEFVLMAMWYGLVPIDSSPHVYGPLEKVLAEIKVASLGGVLVALPVLVYESYLFMRPGLYPKERRYYLAAVPTSLVLGGIGMLFSYFLVLPVLFEYFIYYSEDGVDLLAFGLQVTFDLIVTMLWAFALVFQIPLLIMLAIMMGVTTREWLESKRLYFWGGFIAVGFFLGGIDPTSVAGMIIAATMIGLFEGTLAVLRWAQGDLPWRNRGSAR